MTSPYDYLIKAKENIDAAIAEIEGTGRPEEAAKEGSGEELSSVTASGTTPSQPTGPESSFDSLPWRKNKFGEWIFANQASESLKDKLRDAKKFIDIDGLEYSHSGDGDEFIGRKRRNAK